MRRAGRAEVGKLTGHNASTPQRIESSHQDPEPLQNSVWNAETLQVGHLPIDA